MRSNRYLSSVFSVIYVVKLDLKKGKRMKLYHYWIFAGLTCFLLNCDQNIDPEMASQELLQADRDFAALSADSGAANAFRHYMAVNAIQMPDGAMPMYGRDSIYASLAPFDGRYTLTWEPQLAEVSRSGDMGWTWGIYKGIYVDAQDSSHISHGKYVNVWKKQPDGQWRVRVDIGNKNQRAKN